MRSAIGPAAAGFLIQYIGGKPVSLSSAFSSIGDWFVTLGPTLLVLGLQLPLLFFINLLILFGPLLFFGIQQIKAYEPGEFSRAARGEVLPMPSGMAPPSLSREVR